MNIILNVFFGVLTIASAGAVLAINYFTTPTPVYIMRIGDTAHIINPIVLYWLALCSACLLLYITIKKGKL